MASRVIHLVISKKLEQHIMVKNHNSFRLGNLLPDAIVWENKTTHQVIIRLV